ncbi:MAG: hypothetical protein R3204_16295, partial [Oceanospirillum sp.]|nr:hypothetical protein [Oceanospirillum sp.]
MSLKELSKAETLSRLLFSYCWNDRFYSSAAQAFFFQVCRLLLQQVPDPEFRKQKALGSALLCFAMLFCIAMGHFVRTKWVVLENAPFC